jgi:DNA repair photolyase
MITQSWTRPATIERNNFKFKSLSCWACNVAVGCNHACRFCYVPEVSTNRMAAKLETFGVHDPDAEWGNYVFPRPWHAGAFAASLRAAKAIPINHLNADGNRAVMFCTTTDPYQTLPGELHHQLQDLVTRALIQIRDESTLRVRILTRSPLAKLAFPLFQSFGNRLLFGMSIPTLNNQLAKIYEPKAPAPTQRLAALQAAKAAGIPIYAAVAPTYPECDEADLRATLTALKALDPVTIFMEPINIRADNVQRIELQAKAAGMKLKTEVFATPQTWATYALGQLATFEIIALDLDIARNVVHLWPDQSLIRHFPQHASWLEHHWSKISAWPE